MSPLQTLFNIELKKVDKILIKKVKIPGTVENNEIIFELENMHHIIDVDNQIFYRENDDYSFYLDFLNKNSQLILKKEQYTLDIAVEKSEFIMNSHECKLQYFLETDEETVNLKIEWEEQK